MHLVNDSMTFVKQALTISTAVFLVAGQASAQQTIEMALKPTAGAAANAPKSAPSASASKPRSEVRLPYRGVSNRSGREEGKAIGKVGFVAVDACKIYRSRSTTSGVYFTVKQGTPLGVINTVDSWYGVLMSNGSTGWVPTSALEISQDYKLVADSAAPDGASSDIVKRAYTYMGVPYVWGGTSRRGSDCSGFVKQVWGEMGRSLPRTAREQALVGQSVSADELQAGDRLYFNVKGSYVDHTGIYIGDGKFIHASSSRGAVGVDNLFGSRYSGWLVGARRG